jgi:integration host factor subunit alpha
MVLLQDTRKPLTDAEVESAVSEGRETVPQQLDAMLRSQGDKMTLTKAELADLLFEKVGFNKREAKDMVESFFEEVRTALENGKGVKLSGFGNFQLRDKPQRPGRNPKTGEEIPITARRVVTFHASQKLKAMVEEHYGDGNGQPQPH